MAMLRLVPRAYRNDRLLAGGSEWMRLSNR
jgi:hypothetical protein